ncbi:methyltransferase FkbM [Oscillatoria nigro-viridis PCC 7112]|uniref:Methyltransferase FkbM n=1 Tax=Phormidium nigroviride PCC 7112 TaxID=179408 RepID=K9VKW9_9CYAN|nr:methyltransferase FkbM [Oscillatoria nigro-viridis]AFZ08576.1 methyltransferase FkbM [Oscillatoria nigro-viridis PCC 7112]
MKTPVAFFGFNRPHTTERVFAAIREVKPPKLLLVVDGPRSDKPEEAEKCAEVRAIIEKVDWDCQVYKNYAEANMGCKHRVASGLDWVFNTVEEAIIVEDDCLPNPSFFHFCEEMLDLYRNEPRVMMISGTNYLEEWKLDRQSYHFSYYGGIWGWASWQRAWQFYDINMQAWINPDVKAKIKAILADEAQYKIRARDLENTFQGKVDTWDFQWSFARLAQGGLSIVPCVNLVANLGFGLEATHTGTLNKEIAEMKQLDLKFPLEINDNLMVDREYDRLMFEKLFISHESLINKAIKHLKKIPDKLRFK